MRGDTELASIPAQDLEFGPASFFTGASGEDQYLLFGLHGALYAVQALAVREIHWLPEVTPLVESPPFIVGVINLRGRVVPVMDLSLRLGKWPQPYRLDDCLIILEYEGTALAIIVNEVCSVETISYSQIEAVPLQSQSAGGAQSFLAGVARVGEEVAMLLNLHNIAHWSHADLTSNALMEPMSAIETSASRWLASSQADATERDIFRERARRLMPSVETRGAGELFALALVTLHNESYGIGLDSIREFCELRHVSPVPCCPDAIIGQMNLRGDIVTLLDIQPLLQMPSRTAMENSSVVVVQHEDAPVGIVIDEVADVLYLEEQAIVPAGATQTAAKYFGGSVLHDDKMIYILDLRKLLTEGGLVVEEVV